MRIAACLSGNGRTARYCKPFIDRFFRGHEVDYFIHAWAHDKDHVSLFQPRSVSHSTPPDLGAKERVVITTFNEYSFIRLIPMYWGVSESLRMVPQGEYDVLVRMRPDVVPLVRANASLCKLDDRSIFFAYHMQQAMHAWTQPVPKPNVRNPHVAGYNDLIFFGREDNMRVFERAYDLIDDFCKEMPHGHFTATALLDFILARGTGRPVRAPISLYLIDEEHSRHPLALYEEHRRAAIRREADMRYVQENHPDLVAVFAKDSPPLHARDKWYGKCWVDGPSFVGSPRLSPTAQRIVSKRYAEMRASDLSSNEGQE